MQYYYDLSQLGLKMHFPFNENASCIASSEFEIIGVVSNECKTRYMHKIESENICSLNDFTQYCCCDNTPLFSSSNSFNFSKTSIYPTSSNMFESNAYCSQNPYSCISSDRDSHANYEIRNSSCQDLMELHTSNPNYTIKEKVGKLGEISQVIVCKNNNCTKEFMRMDDFVLHNKVHMKSRPYPCRYCPRAYTQKGNLLKHTRKHTQPDLNKRRVYTCQFCQRGYTEKYNLKTHQMRFHNREFRMMNAFISNRPHNQEDLTFNDSL